MISELSKIFKKETEVVVLNDTKSILFKFVIIKEGELIYMKNHAERLMFELKTMNDYYDFTPFIEKYNEAYLKRELAKTEKD
jgi:hypothetical protein